MNPKPQRASRAGATGYVALVALVPLVVLAAVTVQVSTWAVRDQVDRRLDLGARASAVAVDQQMRGLLEVVDSYAQRPTLVTALEHTPGGEVARSELRLHLDQLRQARPGIGVAFITDERGVLHDVVPDTPGIVGEDFSHRDWYQGATRLGKPYASELYRTAASGGALIVAAAAPVRSQTEPGNPVVGFVVAAYSVDALQANVDLFASAQSAGVTIEDQRGSIVAQPGEAPTDIRRRPPADATDLPGERTEDGTTYLTSHAPVGDLGWTAHVEVPVTEVQGTTDQIRALMVFITGLLGLVIVAGVAMLRHTLRRRDAAERELVTRDRVLGESEQRLRLAVEASKLGMWEFNYETAQFTCSAELRALHGIEDEEPSPDDLVSTLFDEDRERLESALRAMAAGGPEVDMEYRVRTHAGDVRWLSARAAVDRAEDGTPLRIVGVAADETKRRLAEQELRDSQAFLDSVIENLPSMLFVKDAEELRLVRFNRAGESLMGVSRDAVLGRNDFDLLPEGEAVLSTAEDRAVLAGGALLDVPADLVVTPDGERVLHTRKIPILGADGRPRYLLGISEDITARQQAQRDLEQARDEADRANAAKSEFLSRMSHELRTPLNAVLGYAQLLAMEDLTADQADSLGHIALAGQHLLGLINEVLDIARIETGQLSLALETVEVGEVLRAALDLVRPEAASRNVSLPTGEDLPPTYVVADRQRLLQVLLNLLSNAVKYNRLGGGVEVLCAATDVTVSIRVVDTGVGIADADLGRLFTPFERLGATQSEVEGTGVGLALSRVLTQQMGGSLTVTSTSGVGSTFVVELPAGRDPASGPTATVRTDGRSGPSPAAMRVLYIEDNVANVKLIQRAFAQLEGVELVVALLGQRGLDLATRERFDLILLDLHLPDIPGAEVLETLVTQTGHPPTPVVICSADTSPGQPRRLLERGAAHYLAKPIDLRDLFRVVEQVRAGEEIAPGSTAPSASPLEQHQTSADSAPVH